jgi:hypothetical protein
MKELKEVELKVKESKKEKHDLKKDIIVMKEYIEHMNKEEKL